MTDEEVQKFEQSLLHDIDTASEIIHAARYVAIAILILARSMRHAAIDATTRASDLDV